MEYKILADSCCDMTEAMRKDSDFVSVPLSIHFGDELTFVDDADLNQAELLDAMKRHEDAPYTSCPSPQSYMDAFNCGAKNVYVVTLSARLSGSYNSAISAVELFRESHPNVNIHVFDSRSAASGETILALKLREYASSGMSFDEVVKKGEQFVDKMKTLFVLESLENLRKNGRLKKLQAVVAIVLRIKLLCEGTQEGEIGMIGQSLSTKQALNKLISQILADKNHKGKTLVISHCANLERAQWLKSQVQEQCSFAEILITDTRGISTVYANSGGIICAY
ncbi:MAG: DegV family protein [Clostridiales bacterium]|nr:DegV family protein [Clostridiales bacterium]